MSRIVVKNLPPSGVSELELKKHFADVDNVTDIKLKFNEVGNFRRFAFIGFRNEDGAQKAIEKLNSTFIKNNRIHIEECKAIKEVKPNRVPQFGQTKRRNSDSDDEKEDGDRCNKSKSKTHSSFEELKDDPEFKEFLSLQRNLGENKDKQIWADDLKMDATDIAKDEPDDVPKETTGDQEDDLKKKKKHKRSRGKKKSTKTKPKELFVHTVKASGFPETTKRKDVKEFFKPLELLSIRLNKKDGICFVAFKDESDMKFALRKNLQFWNTSRIKLWKHNVKRSRIFKETAREKVKEKEELQKKYETSLAEAEPLEESGRLFVRNLNYTCTQEDLEQVFSKYGELTEVHFPIDKNTSLPKGYAYVEFMFPQSATQAYTELNGTIFQGRNFHLIPSKPKPEPKLLEPSYGGAASRQPMLQSSYKREKFNQQKQNEPRSKGQNWNILFLGQNALADVVANSKGVEKKQLLTEHSHKDPIAVRMALGDATVVDEMRRFLVSNGIELDSFDNPQAPRSRTVILVKNLPSSTDKRELSDMFELHGRVARVLMPPNGLTAIVEMEEPVEAKLAFRRLAYSKFKDSVLFLEWAPINVFRHKSVDDQERDDSKQIETLQTGSKILVKNVPFEATQQELKKLFAAYGELNFVRLPKKVDGQHRGFAFVDFLTKDDALRAFKALCHSTHLYGRKLILQWAKSDSADGNKEDKQQSM